VINPPRPIWHHDLQFGVTVEAGVCLGDLVANVELESPIVVDGDLRVNFCATKNDIPAVVSLFDMEPCKIYYSFHEHKIYFSSWFNSHANIGFSGPTPEGILNNRDERMLKYLMKGFYCCDVGQKMKQQLNLPIN